MDNKTFHSLALLQKRFVQFYRKTGMIGIDSQGCHMGAQDIISLGNYEMSKFDSGKGKWPVLLESNFEGVLFFALASFGDIRDLGLGQLLPIDLQKDFEYFLKKARNPKEK